MVGSTKKINLKPSQSAVLRGLQASSKISMADLSLDLAVSEKRVTSAKTFLEAKDIITGYKAVIDRKRIGLEIMSLILFQMKSSATKDMEVLEISIKGIAEVISCNLILGPYDGYLIVVAPDLESHHEVIRRIANIPGIARTNTCIVSKEVDKKDFPIPKDTV